MTKRRIAFYAPIKPPDHPIPSGDRQMARMLLHALGRAGYDVFLASRLIAYSKRHQAEVMAERRAAARAEAARLLEGWRREGGAPALWLCYHPYDKAPDWLGMEICARLGIPMVTAEACKTGQGPQGEWLPWREQARRGLEMAALHLVMKPSDRAYLSQFVPAERLVDFPPFIDAALAAEAPAGPDAWAAPPGSVRLLAVGMMRPGAKLESYGVLAGALARLGDADWRLAIAGDGPCRPQVEAMFAPAGRRVRLLGEKSPEQVIGLMAGADILAWPGCREAYGMVYLEAASRGVAAAALDTAGVPTVVRHGETGLLADPAQAGAYAGALARLIADAQLRRRLGEGARRFVAQERSVEQAALRLRAALEPLLAAQA